MEFHSRWLFVILMAICFLGISQEKAKSIQIHCPAKIQSNKNANGTYFYSGVTTGGVATTVKSNNFDAVLTDIKFDYFLFGHIARQSAVTLDCYYSTAQGKNLLLKGAVQLANATVADLCRRDGCFSAHNNKVDICGLTCDQ